MSQHSNVVAFPIRPRASIAWYVQIIECTSDPELALAAYLELQSLAQREGFNLQFFGEFHSPQRPSRLADVS